MDTIKSVLKDRKIKVSTAPRRRGNPMYGMAIQMQMDLGIKLPMCFKILKQYDFELVKQLVSWWRDYPFKKDNNYGLLIWKLNQLEEDRKNVIPR